MSRRMLEFDWNSFTHQVQDSDGRDEGDKELAKRVRLFLCVNRNGFRRIVVLSEGGVVRLCGLVKSFYVRQMALMLAQRVAGVRQVVDNLEVDLSESLPRRNAGPRNF
jgi:osmotically-inducible protein OsmY